MKDYYYDTKDDLMNDLLTAAPDSPLRKYTDEIYRQLEELPPLPRFQEIVIDFPTIGGPPVVEHAYATSAIALAFLTAITWAIILYAVYVSLFT